MVNVYRLLPHKRENAKTKTELREGFVKSNGDAKGFEKSFQECKERDNCYWWGNGSATRYYRK